MNSSHFQTSNHAVALWLSRAEQCRLHNSADSSHQAVRIIFPASHGSQCRRQEGVSIYPASQCCPCRCQQAAILSQPYQQQECHTSPCTSGSKQVGSTVPYARPMPGSRSFNSPWLFRSLSAASQISSLCGGTSYFLSVVLQEQVQHHLVMPSFTYALNTLQSIESPCSGGTHQEILR